MEGRVLERLRRLEAVFALPHLAIARDVHVEHTAVHALHLRRLLPAEVIDAAELVEGRLRVRAVWHQRHLLAHAPRFAIGARREVVVALVVAHDGHPRAVGQAIHGGFTELIRLRLVEVTEHLKGLQIVVDQRQRVLFAAEVIQTHAELAIELLERIKDEEGRIHCLFREAQRRRIRMKILRLEIKGARRRLELRLVDRRHELARFQIEVPIPHLRLPLARILAGEVAAQRVGVLL